MTYSHSSSDTFTKAHAIYLVSKVAADLKQMQLFYTQPSSKEIDSYVEELVVLLVYKCLKMVEYGFRQDDRWIAVVRYTVQSGGLSIPDDRAGRVPAGADVSGASWYSYLEYSDKWSSLSDDQREAISNLHSIRRTTGIKPSIGSGGWVSNKTYSRNGTILERGVYSA